MRIELLADHISAVPLLAEWHHATFGYLNPANSVRHYVERLHGSLGREDLPMTFVALDGDDVVGSATLNRTTITHAHLSPWLSSVYVTPAWRGCGIAGSLIGAVEREAKRLGFDTIHLFTPSSERLYARLGWRALEVADIRGTGMTIMSKGLR